MNCEHENIRWTSGEEGVVITLNDYDVECLDCGMTAVAEGIRDSQ